MEVVDCFEIFSLGQTVVSCVVLCINCNQANLCKKISTYDSLLLSYYFFSTTSFALSCLSYHFLQAHSAYILQIYPLRRSSLLVLELEYNLFRVKFSFILLPFLHIEILLRVPTNEK